MSNQNALLTFEAQRLRLQGRDTVIDDSITLAGPEGLADPSEQLPGAYLDRLDEINDSWRIIRDPESGQKFEVAEVNTDQSADAIDLELSTYSSAISTNPGNAAEFALHGFANPEKRRMYVAIMGNGSSDNFSKAELAYLRKTGRLTTGFFEGEWQAQPTIQALRRALDAEKLAVRRLSSDSFGGVIATALMAELEPGQVTHAYLKGRPNISKRNPLTLATDMLIVENEINGRRNRQASEDPWGLHQNDFALVRAAKERLTKVYGKQHEQPEGSKPLQLVSYARGLSRGGPVANPALVDTVAALKRQPNALITIDAPEHDLLYKSPEDLHDILPPLGRWSLVNTVEIIRTPGTHGGHTWEPQRRAAAEAYAFSRT